MKFVSIAVRAIVVFAWILFFLLVQRAPLYAECDGILSGNRGPSIQVYVPHISVALNTFSTTTLFSIKSASSGPALVRLDVYDVNGVIIAPITIQVPANGERSINFRDMLFDGSGIFDPLLACEVNEGGIFNFTISKPSMREQMDDGQGVARGWIAISAVTHCSIDIIPPFDVNGRLTGTFTFVDSVNDFAQSNVMPRWPLASGTKVVSYALGGPFDDSKLLFFSPTIVPGDVVPIGARSQEGVIDPFVSRVGLRARQSWFRSIRELGVTYEFGLLLLLCDNCWAGVQRSAEGRYSDFVESECVD